MNTTFLFNNIAAGLLLILSALFAPSLLAAGPPCQLHWQADTTPIMALAGQWCAESSGVTGQLNVPGTWHNKQLANTLVPGISEVRYQLRVIHGEQHAPLVLRLPRPYDSYRLRVNGTELLATGRYSATGNNERHPHYVQFVADGSSSLIEVDVANRQFVAGGMRSPPVLGLAKAMQEWRARELAIEGFQSGLLVLMAFIQLAQFAAARRVYSAQLFFGLTCLSVAIFSGLGGEQWLSLLLAPWELEPDLRLRWAMIPLAILGLTEFSARLFPDEVHRRPRQCWWVITTLFLLASLLLASRPLALLFWGMEALALFMSGYVLFATFRAARHRRPGALSLTVVYGILFVTVLRDIAVDFYGQYLGNLGPTGMVICLVWQGLLLARHNARAHRHSMELVQQLEQAESVKDEFLANTSHELRTPLQTIIGLASLDSQTSGQQGRNAELIGDTARRLALLVDDLMDLTRMRHQGIHVQTQVVSLRGEFETLRQLFSPVIRRRNLRITLQLTEDDLCAEADPRRLRQVLYNLLGNAVKFTPEGTICLYALPNGDHLRVGVRDTGPGMNSKQLELARLRYQQGAVASEGVGLGLPISHGILHAHGSALEIDSAPGKGTDCHFMLPRAEPSAASPALPAQALPGTPPDPQPSDQPGPPSTDYILVLDDDGCILDTVAQLLSPLARPVLTESHIDQALSLIDQRVPPC